MNGDELEHAVGTVVKKRRCNIVSAGLVSTGSHSASADTGSYFSPCSFAQASAFVRVTAV